jgi:hypothetical protein
MTDKERDTTEILAEALADSNRQANSSNKNTVRVLGTLLAFSVLGNFALAGLNIHGNFFGTEVKMGNSPAEAEALGEIGYIEEIGYADEEPEVPPEEWCAEALDAGDIHPDDEALCADLYPHLFE